MADDSETAARRARARPPRPPAEENDHEHCSDCENEAERGSNRGGLSPANDSGAKKKKKKPKRKKEKGGDQPDQAQDQAVKVNSLPAERIQEIQKAIELFSVGQGPAKTMEEASKRSYQFWDTQPVPKLGEVVNTHGPVEPDKDNIRQEPYTLPQGFSWDALDLGDRGVAKCPESGWKAHKGRPDVVLLFTLRSCSKKPRLRFENPFRDSLPKAKSLQDISHFTSLPTI
ncbi:glycylpeptide N-tetradecanoyltransferase 1-like isoform X2 [Columba livia]|uniref:glycylpeptide N-tetradecanoyltransferase 1-like isoform X2 n=1 Tax=Columba livia TaxID=8932 RepID=UPI0031BA16D5